MKTLVFVFDVSKLNDVEFHKFFEKLISAQDGVPLGLCKYNVFDKHSSMSIMKKLDGLRDQDGEEIGGDS